jgi:hypothetical protein
MMTATTGARIEGRITRRLLGLEGAGLLLEDGVVPETEDGTDESMEGTVRGVGCSCGVVGWADWAGVEIVSAEERAGNGVVALREVAEVLPSADDVG